jgi:agmatinase
MTIQLHENPGAFGGIDPAPGYPAARFAVLPIPYDGTSTWLKGADRGPAAILEASANMELYDIETRSEPWRLGMVTMAPVAPSPTAEITVDRIHETAQQLILEGKTVIGLGGEHSVSIGLIRAHAERYAGLTVLQLDAHADTRDSYEGSRYNHASVMARAAEVCDFVQVGVRSMDRSEMGLYRPDRVFFAHEIEESNGWITDVVARLDGPVYVTVDLDVLDPSEMPSTGTPEPGGLRYRQVTRLLDAVSRAHEIVGFDVVELLPNPSNRAPDFLAARLVYQIAAFIGRDSESDRK